MDSTFFALYRRGARMHCTRWQSRYVVAFCLALAVALGVVNGAARAADAALVSLEISPPEINLFTARASQLFVVQATYADGITRDVTAEARATLANSSLLKLDKN